MSETIRINTTLNSGDNYIKVKLEQDFDFIEVLSLKLSQEDAYKKFCSDYGVIVGRVSVNNGFGVPNAMVSVFIPLDEIDINNPEIKGLYPYEIITDTNIDGVRYNLLPKDGNKANDCRTPIGTFPNKREVLDNEILFNIYEKYYKFTTTTNHAGDFMIFGVPLGTYTVHVDADISDIGIISQRPYDLINQGTPSSMFGSSTKFKSDKNLNNLIQVKTMNAGVNVQPFWGDTDTCEIGINRLDFDLNFTVVPSAIFIGSIYGDQDKHSVNKNCRPRRRVGELCEQITGEGSIEMIRKTFDNKIERFDVDGGRVIDENGTWSYQIPMNLDYMVTSEDGSLIYSQDPNVGIATRTSVRFNIGIDENGGEARLRTRARYLVPNNPNDVSQVDYEFGIKTKDTSFRDLYWNKIYTVSNYISRFQTNSKVEERNMIGVKDVDNCAGTKTPFPYNKVDTKVNPIFIIICLIINVIVAIYYLINTIIVPIINFIVKLLKGVCRIKIPGVGRICTAPDYMKCLSKECSDIIYAPGCNDSKGYAELGSGTIQKEGLADCEAFQMAELLNLFKYDFYNDWVHGSLFSFLLKYKNKKSRSKFCDYDCASTDNRCHTNYLLDSCYKCDGKHCENVSNNHSIREGLIKKNGEELYYAATTHDVNYKMFSTDIANLGSIFDCDWQGIPKINDLLIPTTYKIPPDTQEIDELGNIVACGVVDIANSGSVFFNINCIGIEVDYKGCLNLRHICEMGVDIPETSFDTPSHCTVGAYDIDDDKGKWFRDVFYGLNKKTNTPWVGINNLNIPNSGYTTNFNLTNSSTYDFTQKTENNININGSDYIDFRGYPSGSANAFGQTDNSYYFYFGLSPGKTAIDKMNAKYFASCTPLINNEVLIDSSSLSDTNLDGNGSITFSFIGGNPPFIYSVIGLNYSISGNSSSNQITTITNLSAGTYTISGEDAFGTPINETIKVYGPEPLSAVASVTKNSTTSISNNGEITIFNVSGGKGPYYYTVLNSGIVSSLNTPQVIQNLPVNDTNGYTVVVSDSIGSIYTIYGLKITGVPILGMLFSITQNPCFNSFSASIGINVSGGQPPYTLETTGPDGYVSPNLNLNDLNNGSYVTTVTDALNNVVTETNQITSVGTTEIGLTLATPSVLLKQCNPSYHTITVYVSYSTTPPITVDFVYLDGNDVWQTLTTEPYVNNTTPITFTISTISTNDGISIAVKYNNCYSDLISVFTDMVEKPINVLTANITKSGPSGSGIYIYIVTSTGGIGGVFGTGTFTSTSSTYITTITDSVGCTAIGTI